MSSQAIQLNITASRTSRKSLPREKLKVESGPLPIERASDTYTAVFREMKVGQWVFVTRETIANSAYGLNKCECKGKRYFFTTKRGQYKGKRGVFIIRKA